MANDDNEVLKQLSARAILEFEDAKTKYKEFFDKFTKEESKRRKLESQFKQLKQVSLLAVAEYESLHKQYVTENKYREEVEEKLRKVTQENKEIRKQNSIGANTTILPINNENGAVVGTKGELEVLRAMKDAVNTELRNSKNELNRTKEVLEQEKAAHEITLKRLNAGVQQMNQLNRVSIMAMDEFTELKKKFDIENSCRKKAENVATELVVKQELTERKSRIINEEEQDQLKQFIEEIEAINAKAATEKKISDEKIGELEEQLADAQNVESLKGLEEKLSLVIDQLDLSQKQLVEAEERATKAETNTRNMYTRLALAEREFESTRSSALPPPPPPPPPPIAAPVIRKFITKIGRRKKNLAAPTQEDDQMVTAMADMIERIKKGVKLRPVASSSQLKESQEDGTELNTDGAMGDLAGLLTTLRQGRQESVDVQDEKPEPEFARFKLKKTASLKTDSSVDEDSTSSELKKKLAKQKSVADGIQEETETENPSVQQVESTQPLPSQEESVQSVQTQQEDPVKKAPTPAKREKPVKLVPALPVEEPSESSTQVEPTSLVAAESSKAVDLEVETAKENLDTKENSSVEEKEISTCEQGNSYELVASDPVQPTTYALYEPVPDTSIPQSEKNSQDTESSANVASPQEPNLYEVVGSISPPACDVPPPKPPRQQSSEYEVITQ